MDSDQTEKNDPFGLSKLNDPTYEAAERAKLRSIGDAPTKEIQSKFGYFVLTKEERIKVPHSIRTVPGKLFCATECDYVQHKDEQYKGWKRSYYDVPDRTGFSDKSLSKKLDLSKKGDIVVDASIALSSEQGSGAESTLYPQRGSEGIWFGFTDQIQREDMSMDFGGLQIVTYVQGEKLQIDYHKGRISFIVFSSDQKSDVQMKIEGRPEETNGTIKLEELKRGKQSVDLSDGHYEVEIGSKKSKKTEDTTNDRNDEKFIFIKRLVKQEVVDYICIPLEVHAGDIFKSLIPTKLVVNPYQCGLSDEDAAKGEDLKYDDEWKNSNLTTFDIAWKRNANS